MSEISPQSPTGPEHIPSHGVAHGVTEPHATRERILEAAGEVIAEVGFRDATVRDICSRAGANLAAVNYHFRDKTGLYAEVFERARCASDASWLTDLEAAAGLPAEQRLGMFITGFVRKLLDPGRPGWHAKLVSREMIEPTGALDVMVEKSIRPQFEMLCGIVGEMLGVPAQSHPSYLCGASVIGQCLHYHHTREVTNRLYPGFYDEPQIIETIAAHVTAFSLHAIRGLAAQIQSAGGEA